MHSQSTKLQLQFRLSCWENVPLPSFPMRESVETSSYFIAAKLGAESCTGTSAQHHCSPELPSRGTEFCKGPLNEMMWAVTHQADSHQNGPSLEN